MSALSREDLISFIWPNVFVGDESLTQTVSEIRRVLKQSDRPKPIVETIPKFGYRLTVPIVADEPGHYEPPATGEFDLQAYTLCLEARRALSNGGPEAIKRPVQLTEEAVARAPKFAFARAEYAIALCYGWLYQRGDALALRRAFENADEAVRMRPNEACGHAARGFAFGVIGEHGKMKRAFETAFKLDQSDFHAHLLAVRALFCARDYRATLALGVRAAELHPDDFRSLFFAARAATILGSDQAGFLTRRCNARIQAALSADPTDARALHTLGPVLAMLGHMCEARQAITRHQSLKASPCMFYDALGFALTGDRDLSANVFARTVDLGWRHKDWLCAEGVFNESADQKISALVQAM